MVHQRLVGRTVVITGAASGFGRASAQLCAAEGAFVVLLDKDESAVQAVARGIGEAAVAMACDVSLSESVERAFAGLGRVDGLINSAGIARRLPLADQDEDGWDDVIGVNLKGVYLCSREAIRRMPPTGGSIVHISSAVALIGFRNRPVYTATKGAIVALTRNMALDYGARGIRVNCICPGFARTGLTEGLFRDPERKATVEAMHPLGRMGEPEDVGKAALFLLSDDASWITGIAMPVDGGISAGHQHDI